ncbi:MAG: dTDP-4-dehydrorhamnose 3,5-epimerase [Candidatus Gastranaerophilaceae bacterium]|jgi:dTDP-4-dehydrorhamnose 3,5-epimerase
MPFEFEKLNISGPILVKPEFFSDSRGFFAETYKKSEFVKNGITPDFNQDNTSYSVKNVIRGLHYQKSPHVQAKLVRCIKGKIYDVAVDVRCDSPTLGKWIGVELSDENNYMLYIPEGFAHGFSVLSDNGAIIAYKASAEFSKESERGILYNDKTIGIDWKVDNPTVSGKDLILPSFNEADLECLSGEKL